MKHTHPHYNKEQDNGPMSARKSNIRSTKCKIATSYHQLLDSKNDRSFNNLNQPSTEQGPVNYSEMY